VGRYTMQYRLMATHYPSAIHYRIGLCQSKHQWKRHASAPSCTSVIVILWQT